MGVIGMVLGDVDTQVNVVGDQGKEIESAVGGLVLNGQYQVYMVGVVQRVK
jgi:hypothetical protein